MAAAGERHSWAVAAVASGSAATGDVLLDETAAVAELSAFSPLVADATAAVAEWKIVGTSIDKMNGITESNGIRPIKLLNERLEQQQRPPPPRSPT